MSVLIDDAKLRVDRVRNLLLVRWRLRAFVRAPGTDVFEELLRLRRLADEVSSEHADGAAILNLLAKPSRAAIGAFSHVSLIVSGKVPIAHLATLHGGRRLVLAAFTRAIATKRDGILDRNRNRVCFDLSDVVDFLMPHLDVPSTRWGRAELHDAVAQFCRAAQADPGKSASP